MNIVLLQNGVLTLSLFARRQVLNLLEIYHIPINSKNKLHYKNITDIKKLQVEIFSITGLDKQNICKIVHIFLPIRLNICSGCSKEPSH